VKNTDIPIITAKVASKTKAISIINTTFLLWRFRFSDLCDIVEKDCLVDDPAKLGIHVVP